MALGSTIYTFDISLTDMDRGVYETLNLRPAQHPSESVDYLLTRVLAYCLEYEEGIAFSRGLAESDEPAVWVRDPTGQIKAWIDIGAPEAPRLHKASKTAERVAIYTYRNPLQVKQQLAGKRIHQSEQIPIYAFERQFLDALSAQLDRRMEFSLMITERQLYLNLNNTTLTGNVVEHRIE